MLRNSMFIIFWMIVSFCITVIALPIISIAFLIRIIEKIMKKQNIFHLGQM